MTPEELFGPGATQVDMLAMVLDAFPGHRDGVMVPIHVKVRRGWAEQLIRRGVRIDPELMEEFPVPGDHPEAGPLNPTRWVKRPEFDEYAKNRPTAAQAEQQLRNLLRVIDPGRLSHIDAMSDPEKREALAKQAPQIGDLVQELRQASALIAEQQAAAEKKRAKEEPDDD